MKEKGCRILLVENSKKDHDVIEKFVKEKGVPYDTVSAASLAEAKQACTLYRDIVEATHTLRRVQGTARVKWSADHSLTFRFPSLRSTISARSETA
jgi:CheY-like chemotaxis protein